ALPLRETVPRFSSPPASELINPAPVSVLPDTNPPSVTITNIRQATILDTPFDTPYSWKCVNRMGACSDPLGGWLTTNRIEMAYYAVSNHCYVLWYATTLSPRAPVWLE